MLCKLVSTMLSTRFEVMKPRYKEVERKEKRGLEKVRKDRGILTISESKIRLVTDQSHLTRPPTASNTHYKRARIRDYISG